MKLIIGILFGILIYWYRDVLFIRNYKRINYYEMVKLKSIETHKPIMVIGDPDTGAPITRLYKLFKPYDYGDVCIDITGCPKSNLKKEKGKLENIITKYKNNSHVIFISVVLEYIDNIEYVINELIRVSGGDVYVVAGKNMHNSYTDDKTIFSLKNKIIKSPPEFPYFEYITIKNGNHNIIVP